VDELRKQGDHEGATKLMREAEAAARTLQEQAGAVRRESGDDLRAGLRQVQQELKDLREQLKKLLDERASKRE
jgi:hypothetical protein